MNSSLVLVPRALYYSVPVQGALPWEVADTSVAAAAAVVAVAGPSPVGTAPPLPEGAQTWVWQQGGVAMGGDCWASSVALVVCSSLPEAVLASEKERGIAALSTVLANGTSLT